MSAGVTPYWGHPDANVEWCERNYAVTPYVAEFYNTISSVPIFLLGVFGAINTAKYAIYQHRFMFSYFFMAMVGLGSTAFHMTMRYYAQVLDELPMLYGNMALLFTIIEDEKHQQYPYLPLLMIIYSSTLTFIYLSVPSLYAIFFIGYAAAVIVQFFLSVFRIRKAQTPVLARNLFIASCVTYLSGFSLWVFENNFCEYLPEWWQLHALWHILAGLGTYLWIQFTVVLRAVRFESTSGLDHSLVVPFVVVESAITTSKSSSSASKVNSHKQANSGNGNSNAAKQQKIKGKQKL